MIVSKTGTWLSSTLAD